MSESGIVSIHGKDYKTVALRITQFRIKHPDYGIETELLERAELVSVKAVITNENGRVISSGYAEEMRGSTNINKTSAVENCETSAVGRALAFFGLAGSEIASADEVTSALATQATQELVDYNKCVRANIQSIAAIKDHLYNENMSSAIEAMIEINRDDQIILWRAPTKGGIFTTGERATMKSDEWGAETRAQNNNNQDSFATEITKE